MTTKIGTQFDDVLDGTLGDDILRGLGGTGDDTLIGGADVALKSLSS